MKVLTYTEDVLNQFVFYWQRGLWRENERLFFSFSIKLSGRNRRAEIETKWMFKIKKKTNRERESKFLYFVMFWFRYEIGIDFCSSSPSRFFIDNL